MNTKSISFRLNILFVILVTTLLIISGAVHYVKSKNEREGSIEQQTELSLGRLGTSLPNPLWNYDKAQVEQVLRAEMSAGFLQGITIVNDNKPVGGLLRNSDGKLQTTEAPPKQFDRKISRKLSFLENGKPNPVGEVTVFISFEEVRAALRHDLLWLGGEIILLDLILISALAFSLNWVVLSPLAQVLRAIHNIATGEADLTQRMPSLGHASEFEDIASSFNVFLERLETIIMQIRVSIDNITSAATEIAHGNHDLSARTEAQASSLEQTAAAMEQLTSTVKQNAENARDANRSAAAASEVADKGGAVVSQVVSTMGEIDASAKKIVDIISVIDGIAFQTNILALNAAVEAARAGEQGRGFAVVAAEVRNLAQRSAAAAREVKALIGDSVHKVSLGTVLVNQAGSTIGEVVTSVQQVSAIMGAITLASEEQTIGIEQVDQAIDQMDQSTQQNAALVEQATAAAQSLQDQAQQLAQAIGAFKTSAPGGRPLSVVGNKTTATPQLAIPMRKRA
jgi:methyl-accepting chemotaxis protein